MASRLRRFSPTVLLKCRCCCCPFGSQFLRLSILFLGLLSTTALLLYLGLSACIACNERHVESGKKLGTFHASRIKKMLLSHGRKHIGEMHLRVSNNIQEYDDGAGAGERSAITLNLQQISWSALKASHPTVLKGGQISSQLVYEKANVAIIIPFRRRESHLSVLLGHLWSILDKKRDLSVRIFVIEQGDSRPFNRGKLMNIGFREALRTRPCNCFVFHDVDLIPENFRIPYGCERSPMHLSVAVDKFGYQLPYETIFGGVEMFTKRDFELVNGFPNTFFGWGGEDDNLYHRIQKKGLTLYRPRPDIARYSMLVHENAQWLSNSVEVQERLESSLHDVDEDGLNSLQYRVLSVKMHDLFTLIKVDLNVS